VLLAVLGPLFVFCGAPLRPRLEGRIAWLPVQVAPGPDGLPVVRGFVAGTGAGPGLEAATCCCAWRARLAGSAASASRLRSGCADGLRAPSSGATRGGAQRLWLLDPVRFPLRTLPLT
jgi:hypothetical protein